MLCRGDLFDLEGVTHRLVDTANDGTRAWIIKVGDEKAMPVIREMTELADCAPLVTDGVTTPKQLPEKWYARSRQAAERIRPLAQCVPDIYDPSRRSHLILARAKELHCSDKTLYKDLRRWWQRGQCEAALLPDWKTVTGFDGGTGRRGRTSKEYPTYQLAEQDLLNFRMILEKEYLVEDKKTLKLTFGLLLSSRYSYLDGNGKSFLKPKGQRPTPRQLAYFLKTHYPREEQIRKREGDKAFERDHKPKLEDILVDNNGVGHRYETDGSWIDITITSSDNVLKIVGFALLYLIVDQRSRLITGFYLGLDSANFDIVREAIISISQDKREMCESANIVYNPADWPAHEICPQIFLSDRGPEVFGNNSDLITQRLHATVGNTPAMRADFKCFVECGFKLINGSITEAPGYETPADRRSRMKDHNDKYACLTLAQLKTIILRTIILYNNTPIPKYPRTLDQIGRRLVPTPINLWNDDISRRAGQLRRMRENDAREKLMPSATASVTKEGILFRGCYYLSTDPYVRRMIIDSDDGRKKISVRYDRRLVNTIFLEVPDRHKNLPIARLSPRSEKYRGMHFDEVAKWEGKISVEADHEWDQIRLQVEHEHREDLAPTVAAAKKNLADAGHASRKSRKANLREDRAIELKREHQQLGGAQPESGIDASPANTAPAPTNVAGLPVRLIAGNGTTASSPGNPERALSAAAIARRKMLLERDAS